MSNLTLDFGLDPTTGAYRRWTTADTVGAAEIRVSFGMNGYWSLVGTDSTDTTIDPSGGPIGGLPGQRSLNLGGYKLAKPQGWQGTVRHEFLHALAFQHEHAKSPCTSGVSMFQINRPGWAFWPWTSSCAPIVTQPDPSCQPV